MKKTLFALAGAGILAAIFVYVFVWNKDHPDYEFLDADYTIAAEVLYNEFVQDAEKASLKYNGKILQISGTASDFEKVDTLSIAVFVYNEGMFGNEGVRCTFLGNQNITDISNLKNMDIKGFCSGFNDSDVIIEKCSLVKP